MGNAAIDKQRTILYFEREGTPPSGGDATAETLAAADAIYAKNIKHIPRGGPVERTDTQTGHGGGAEPIQGKRAATTTFATDLFLPTTKGDIDTMHGGDLWRALPVKITENASTSVEIEPISAFVYGARSSDTSYVEPGTLGVVHIGGNEHKSRGNVGSIVIKGGRSDIIQVEWTMQGQYYTAPIAANLTSPVYTNLATPLLNMGASLTVDSLTGDFLSLGAWEIDLGMQLMEQEDSGKTYGYAVSRAKYATYATLKMQVRAGSETDVDLWAQVLAHSDADVTLTVGSANKRFTFNMPTAKLFNPEEAEDGENRDWSLIMKGWATDDTQWHILFD